MSTKNKLPEHWLRGPLPGIPDLLQPAAHALLQSVDEIKEYTRDFPSELIHKKPAGRASVAFHLKHITGVLDRMLTYAAAHPLNNEQFDYLKKETQQQDHDAIDALIIALENKVNQAMNQFKNTAPETLTEPRGVGRKELPSTVIGLYFHAAEHSQRHVGQLLVTVSILKESNYNQ